MVYVLNGWFLSAGLTVLYVYQRTFASHRANIRQITNQKPKKQLILHNNYYIECNTQCIYADFETGEGHAALLNLGFTKDSFLEYGSDLV